MIPLAIPNFEGNEKKYVDAAMEQGWGFTGGAYIKELEWGVEPGDMVIVPCLTFIAAVNLCVTSLLSLFSWTAMTACAWKRQNSDNFARKNVPLRTIP